MIVAYDIHFGNHYLIRERKEGRGKGRGQDREDMSSLLCVRSMVFHYTRFCLVLLLFYFFPYLLIKRNFSGF